MGNFCSSGAEEKNYHSTWCSMRSWGFICAPPIFP